MNGITFFVRRFTRHGWPVFFSIIVFVVTPAMLALDEQWEALAKNPNPNWYEMRKPRTKTIIAVLLAIGALRNQTIHERRRKIAEEETAHRQETESNFLRRGIREGQQGKP